MGMSYPTARDEQAAYWYLRLQEPEVTAEEIQAALAWQSDPENRAAFERVGSFWRAWPSDGSTAVRIQPAKRMRRRRIWAAAAALLATVSTSLWIAISQWQGASEPTVVEYTTAVGQVRTVELEDGSEVILGAATSIRTQFSRDVRRIVMSDGEALFFVAKDQERPFIVDVPNGSTRALGTAFNVHRGPDEATITVLEGVVQVSPPSWRPGASANLPAGTQVPLSTDGILGRIRKVNPQEVASWRSGRMILVDRTLRSVIADLNRYSDTPVTLAAIDAADERVSGTIKLDRIDEWLRALGPAFGLDLVRNEHGMVLVARADRTRDAAQN